MATEFIDDVVTPVELTGYARELVDGDLPLADVLPPLEVEDIEYELSNADMSNAGEVARYRSWDTAPPIGRRPGVSEIKGEIPPLGWSYRLNEKDVLRFERIRAGVAERYDEAVRDVIFNDAERAARSVQNRVTLAHGDILQTGGVKLTELGNVTAGNELVAQFAVPAAHLNVVPAGPAWTDHANSKPITDLKTWEATYRSNNGGRNPDEWRISSEIMADLTQNASIRNLTPVMGVVPGIISEDTVRQVARAMGVNAPLVVANDLERPTLTSGTQARVIGVRKVVGVRTGGAMGRTLYGPTANALTLAGNGQLVFEDTPGIIAYMESGIRPAWRLTTAEAVVLPVLTDPRALFVATV